MAPVYLRASSISAGVTRPHAIRDDRVDNITHSTKPNSSVGQELAASIGKQKVLSGGIFLKEDSCC